MSPLPGVRVERRAPSPEERAAVLALDASRRAGLSGHVWGQVREALFFGVIASVVLVPAAMFLPFERDAELLKGGIATFWGVLMVIAAVGAARGVKEARRRLAAFDVEAAAGAATVEELRFETTRVLAATDRDGDGQDWWFFALADGYLVLEDQGDRLGSAAWRRTVRVVRDGHGRLLLVETSGGAVPMVDGRLQPPDFEPEPTSAFWSPPDDGPRAPCVVTREVLVEYGEWPEGSP